MKWKWYGTPAFNPTAHNGKQLKFHLLNGTNLSPLGKIFE
jgi:hypothetical protein